MSEISREVKKKQSYSIHMETLDQNTFSHTVLHHSSIPAKLRVLHFFIHKKKVLESQKLFLLPVFDGFTSFVIT